ncbi:MAG: SpoIID/LytB domain protein [Parcubacteria group bacterium GW2011_GWC2_39_14]|nr:MAG: SpoIID/LytB domain protein [Parcubacteria group bacterium GW2011_GWC2_39_14]KKR55226.1 MAG: SpoIID/LytB domain protein [Parcubacteria group bacterium GW2011_GWA2_40_23]
MTTTKTKYLSYFGNLNNQARIEELHAAHGALISIFVGFLLVVSAASGLRFLETNLPRLQEAASLESLRVKVAMAAELTNKAEPVDFNPVAVNIKPTTALTLTLKFKNTGTKTWTKKTVYLKSLTTALKFKHKFWKDPYLPAQLTEDTVKPDEIGTFKFALTSPDKFNYYEGDFLVVNNNVMISGSETTIRLNVVADPANWKPVVVAPPVLTVPTAANTQPQMSVCSLKLKIANSLTGVDNETCDIAFGLPDNGPMMRVGLFTTENSITIFNNQAWQVYDANDILLASVPAGQPITFYYSKDKSEYAFDFIDHTVRTNLYLKLSNFNNGFFTVSSYDDKPSWNSNINYNDFKGNLEIRYNDFKKRVWLIESLPLEEYIKGIKETSNSDPIEYQKAMVTAARTYALYHHNTGTKHGKEFFDVDAYYDQVYKGYVAEQIMPRQVEAVAATSGVIATYNNEIIVAAYFARSDGRTRSYKEVWGKDIPYLVSVPTSYTASDELFGHGVGIDATDALRHAKNDNWTYDRILKYYYTNVLLEKIY